MAQPGQIGGGIVVKPGHQLTATHSVPEGLETYRDCVSQRMQMAAEDGRRLFDDGQKIIGVITRSLNGG